MKLDSKPRHLESAGLGQTSDFTIQASAKAFQILSGKLYSDPIMAIIRELICNAYDAHLRAGKADTPVEVHLPTELDCELRIKDYGTGMSYDAMHTLATAFFGSDKNHSNDEIGGLGLGSKSPYSYTDQYTVISRHQGQRHIYQAYIKPDGTPGLADIAGPMAATEPDGLEVVVPCKPSDIQGFAQRYARFAKYMPVQPQANHPPVDPPQYTSEITHNEFRVGLNTHANTVLRQGSRIIMGVVPYSLSNEQREHLPEHIKYLDIYAPIGTFDVAPSRETLSLNSDDYTRLADLVGLAAKRLAVELLSEIAAAPNIVVATKRARTSVTTAGQFFRHTIAERATWRGIRFGVPGYRPEAPDTISYPDNTCRRLIPSSAINGLAAHIETRGPDQAPTIRTAEHKGRNPFNITQDRYYYSIPERAFWSAEKQPYHHLRDTVPPRSLFWYLWGPREQAAAFVRLHGLVLEDLPAPPARTTSRGRTSSRSSAAAKYTTFDHNRSPAQYTLDELEDQLKAGDLLLIMPPRESDRNFGALISRYASSMDPSWWAPPEPRKLRTAEIPESHKRVYRRLQKLGAFLDAKPLFRAYADCIDWRLLARHRLLLPSQRRDRRAEFGWNKLLLTPWIPRRRADLPVDGVDPHTAQLHSFIRRSNAFNDTRNRSSGFQLTPFTDHNQPLPMTLVVDAFHQEDQAQRAELQELERQYQRFIHKYPALFSEELSAIPPLALYEGYIRSQENS